MIKIININEKQFITYEYKNILYVEDINNLIKLYYTENLTEETWTELIEKLKSDYQLKIHERYERNNR